MGDPSWRAKRLGSGQVIPACWVNDAGYSVALCRLPETRFTVTRPGGSAPFAYVGSRAEVELIIAADLQASEVPA